MKRNKNKIILILLGSVVLALLCIMTGFLIRRNTINSLNMNVLNEAENSDKSYTLEYKGDMIKFGVPGNFEYSNITEYPDEYEDTYSDYLTFKTANDSDAIIQIFTSKKYKNIKDFINDNIEVFKNDNFEETNNGIQTKNVKDREVTYTVQKIEYVGPEVENMKSKINRVIAGCKLSDGTIFTVLASAYDGEEIEFDDIKQFFIIDENA